MSIQTLNWGGNAGGNIGAQAGAGLSEGMQALADLKLKQYAERQQVQQNYDRYEKAFGPGFGKLAYMPEKMGLLAMQGKWDPNAQQKQQGQQPMGGQQSGGIEQLLQQLTPQNIGFEGGSVPGTGLPMNSQYNMQQAMQDAMQPNMQQPEMGAQPNMQQQPMGGQQQPVNTGTQPTSDIGQAIRNSANLKADSPSAIRAANAKESKAVQPFVHERSQYLESLAKEKLIAEQMIDIVKKHSGKFPGTFWSNVPKVGQELWIDDPDVRNYMNLGDQLVLSSAQELKGRPSNYVTQLVEAGKAKLNLPAKSKLFRLQQIVDNYDAEVDKQQWIESQRDPQSHLLPLEIESMATNYSLSRENPLKYPGFYPLNAVIRNKDTGEKQRRVIDKQGNPTWKVV